ncbi:MULTISPECIES: hypothetical protein [Agromyces]|uniref:Uncharacterized protein n=1 Tax=Agromyces mediolanus TaxID=41986 RepID=A0A918FAX9_AGRME|nr:MULTISPECIES: hypothetical protein [Agromyces]MCD1571232.1 hypothetical protein [Agromyces mediolanus]GGR17363.1 hypothetical protein GCM10010196_07730 [Agromyces mediolanus]GLJ71615.1 hypothetical protein GCM10017583_08710 [Agromyces mediolanus]GLU88090.1 hypothetical protein Agsp01_03450 [Agromyces sp. NBRC 114283]
MNPTTITTIGTTESRASDVRTGARMLRERVAARLGLALLEWSRRHDERRTHRAVAHHREAQRIATALRDEEFARIALSVTAR